MKKHLMQIGNSLALIIDKPVLELLHIGKDTELEISTDGDRLLISPIRAESQRSAFAEALKDEFKRHAPVFKKLAKGH